MTGGLALAACTEPAPTETSQATLADAGADAAAAAATHRYRITLENLTTGQVFSPGVAATHTRDASVWADGAVASEGIRLIVVDIASPTSRVGGGAPLPNPQTFEITAAANANRLSLAVMLICTNDGFAGLSGVQLPGGFRPDVHEVGVWDAGTEQNNERFDQIVDPCTGVGPVAHPPDWSFPVARITVQRIN